MIDLQAPINSDTFKSDLIKKYSVAEHRNDKKGASLTTSRKRKPELTAVSLFSGGGGLDLGLEAVGFQTLFASDIDFHSCQTLKRGKDISIETGRPFLRHAHIVQQDICEIEPSDILEATGRKPGEISLLAGGPPCQAFSVFGKRRGREDPRGQLGFQYLRILAGLRPAAFVFENVYGMLSIEGGAIFEEMCARLSNPSKDLHYTLSIHRFNAVDAGAPQFRDRVFIIGHASGGTVPEFQKIASGLRENLFKEIPAADDLPRWRTVRDALRGLPLLGQGNLANHVGRVHSSRIVERYASLRPGERDHHTRINKLDLDRPSYTIIVGSDKGGGKGHVHPIEPREVTPRESARMQTFPDFWEFSGTSRHPIRQVGNAVPPLLAAAVGNEIRSHIFGKNKVSTDAVLDSLDQQHLFAEE